MAASLCHAGRLVTKGFVKPEINTLTTLAQ